MTRFPIHEARAARALTISSSTRGRIRGYDQVDAGCIGMQAIRLIQFGIRGHPLKEKWIEDDRVSRGKRRIDGIEIARVFGPRLRGACIPASRTPIRRSASLRKIASSAAFVTFGSRPRKASLAPSSRMTASVPSGTDQSRRLSPPEAVSPETPAFTIVAATPFASSAVRALPEMHPPLAGQSRPSMNPRGRPHEPACPPRLWPQRAQIHKNNVSSSRYARRWTRTGFLPYERGCGK